MKVLPVAVAGAIVVVLHGDVLAGPTCELAFAPAAEQMSIDKRYTEQYEALIDAAQSGSDYEVFDRVGNLLERVVKENGSQHPYNSFLLSTLASAADYVGDHSVADEALERLKQLYLSKCSKTDEFFVSWLLSDVLHRVKHSNTKLAVQNFEMAIEALGMVEPSANRLLGEVEFDYGNFLFDLKRYSESAVQHHTSVDRLLEASVKADERIGGTLFQLAEKYTKAKAFEQAESLLKRLQKLAAGSGWRPDRVAQTHDALGRLYVEMHRWPDAKAAFTKAVHVMLPYAEEMPLIMERAEGNLARFLEFAATKEEDPETAALRGEMTLAENQYGLLHASTIRLRQRLADRLIAIGRHEEAGELNSLLGVTRPPTLPGELEESYDAFLESKEL